ncbi:metallophosphoesterase [Bordetella sp. N]|uniref:metallophosphoesterase n=1 Tax=Bordetella sp. N TaxID=1746199 RepID=UPI00070ED0F3|nr:metallophosphoesterase [Bordetella sp. N]ALM85688.1 metallophosphoesterase [Bordetella sp. N]
MRLQLLSDLHLEHNHDFVATPAPGADLLILAGDIGSCRGSEPADMDTHDFALRQFSPRNGWPTPVLYLPGNHEYDRVDFDAVHARLRALCDELDIQWLERETLVVDGVRFVGTTLWADFDALATPRDTMKQVLDKRGKAFRAADFYLAKAATERDGQPFMAEQMRAQALACQEWLRAALAQPFDGTTVAVTHFAPTLASADPRYGVTPGTAGFCNSLDELLPQADLWLHGHLHCAFDYVKDGCRVVANPLGYEDKGEQVGFQPHCLIEIPAS